PRRRGASLSPKPVHRRLSRMACSRRTRSCWRACSWPKATAHDLSGARFVKLSNTNAGRSVIAVGSGKGGVGKTWLAITLAQSFAEAGQRTLLFDGDLGLAN